MRAYSTPVVVDVPASARLTDIRLRAGGARPGLVVLRRKAEPGAVVLRRRTGQAAVAGRHRAASSATRSRALAKGLMAAGIGAGDRVALMSRTRYEWTVVDYAIWTAGAVTVPVYETSSAEQVEWILTDSGAAGDRRSRPRRIAGDRRGAAAAAGRAADLADRGRRGGRPVARRAGGRGRRRSARPTSPAPGIGRGRGPGHDHLHLGHHRPPEGLRADPRQPAGRRRATRSRGPLSVIFERPARSTLLFLPLAHSLRADHPGRRAWRPAPYSGTSPTRRRCCRTWPRSSRRSCWPSPGCSRRSTTARSSRRRKAGSRARSSTRRPGRLPPGAARSAPATRPRPAGPAGPAPCCGSSMPSSTAWSTASCAPRSAAGCATRCPAALRSGERLGHFFRGVGITDPRGVRAHRDHRRRHGEPARPQQDRHRRPAAARRVRADRRGRRDPPHRARPSSSATGTTTPRPPRR